MTTEEVKVDPPVDPAAADSSPKKRKRDGEPADPADPQPSEQPAEPEKAPAEA
ncbi:hypothetical protein HK102_005564, partial [Quaeritorhiza haematococci]